MHLEEADNSKRHIHSPVVATFSPRNLIFVVSLRQNCKKCYFQKFACFPLAQAHLVLMPNGLFQRTFVPKMVISCPQGRCKIYRKSLVVTKWSQRCLKNVGKVGSKLHRSCPMVVSKLPQHILKVVPKLS